MNKKVTCVIAAYNEEKRIGNVLKVVSKHPLIDEIIVVDDGSTDGTSKITKRFKNVKLISYKKNKGKTSALLIGIAKAKGDYISLVDSDLIGLNKKNVSSLLNPVINNEVDVVIGLRSKHKLNYNIFDLMVLLSGERTFRRNTIDLARFSNLPGYGFESVFNTILLQKKLQVKFVPLPNVRNTAKMEKIGFLKGLMKEFRMGGHILRAVGFLGCLREMLFLRGLSVD